MLVYDLYYNEKSTSSSNSNLSSTQSKVDTLDNEVIYGGRYNRGADITKYVTDGSLWSRIAGTNGFKAYEDIFPWDYITLPYSITAAASGGGQTTGTNIVRVAQRGRLASYQYSGNCLIMVPDTHFGMSFMNSTNTTELGYTGSFMAKTILPDIDTQLEQSNLAGHIKTTNELLSTAMSNALTNRFGEATGAASNWSWVAVKCVLMSEVEVYGSTVWSSSGYDTGTGWPQLEIFKNNKGVISGRGTWLRDIASRTRFSYAIPSGYANYADASGLTNVSPRFVIA